MQSYDKTLAIVGSAVLGACLVAGSIATLGKDLSVVESPALKFGADAAASEPLKPQDSAGKAQAISAEQAAAEKAAAEKAAEKVAAEKAAAHQAAAQQAQVEAAAAPAVTEVPAPQPKHVASAPKSGHDGDRWDGDRDRHDGDDDGDRWDGDRDRGGDDRRGDDRGDRDRDGGDGGDHDRDDDGGHHRH